MDRAFADRKTEEAVRAGIRALATVEDCSAAWPVRPIGNAWSRKYYDGDFHLFEPPPPPPSRPAVSLVFVHTKDGNTGADNPGDLGGGPTDLHLIYEGLSRVAANGVLAGASTVGRTVFFTVWHPELVSLRRELGLPRHPAQIVVSNDGRIDLDSMVFNEPEVPVFMLAGAGCRTKHAAEFLRRPWVTVVPTDASGLGGALARLRADHGIERVSAVGGRTIATALIDQWLVQDLYLTTSAIDGGEPNTPFYCGKQPPKYATIVRKTETGTDQPIKFEHLALT
ncbi:MAG: dihydrofolate reductase family protein [Acidobacteriota bacterium]|nr:dihydrofolate reductase family protein [Acidobacteriota bacterium]